MFEKSCFWYLITFTGRVKAFLGQRHKISFQDQLLTNFARFAFSGSLSVDFPFKQFLSCKVGVGNVA